MGKDRNAYGGLSIYTDKITGAGQDDGVVGFIADCGWGVADVTAGRIDDKTFRQVGRPGFLSFTVVQYGVNRNGSVDDGLYWAVGCADHLLVDANAHRGLSINTAEDAGTG